MIENTIFARNRQGKKAITLNLPFPSLEIVELSGRAGVDAIFVDGEHGPFTLTELESIVALAHAQGQTVFGRIPNTRPDTVTQWLDRGIQGLMAPHVETGDQAQTLAEAAFYPPIGQRSWGTGRGNLFNDEQALTEAGGRRAVMDTLNANTWLYAQVESKRGYENLDEILAVDGLQSITFGPFDLGTSLGLAGEGAGHPEIDRVQTDIAERTHAAGKTLMSDHVAMIGLGSILSGAMRAFVEAHRDDGFSVGGWSDPAG